jgi:CBS-domain-containing membrane protein
MALTVGVSILLMQWTKTEHPPAGADPLVVMLSGVPWSFIFTPVLAGGLLIVAIGYYYHKAAHTSYPKRWW